MRLVKELEYAFWSYDNLRKGGLLFLKQRVSHVNHDSGVLFIKGIIINFDSFNFYKELIIIITWGMYNCIYSENYFLLKSLVFFITLSP